MVGIENLKKALSFVFGLLESLEEKLEDKKLDWGEAFALAYDARGILDLIKVRKLIGEEIVDLDRDEVQELYEWAVAEFDLDNDEAEQLIEDGLDLVRAIVVNYWNIKDLIKKE